MYSDPTRQPCVRLKSLKYNPLVSCSGNTYVTSSVNWARLYSVLCENKYVETH